MKLNIEAHTSTAIQMISLGKVLGTLTHHQLKETVVVNNNDLELVVMVGSEPSVLINLQGRIVQYWCAK